MNTEKMYRIPTDQIEQHLLRSGLAESVTLPISLWTNVLLDLAESRRRTVSIVRLAEILESVGLVRHMHVTQIDTESCELCGRNFRDGIHLRQGELPSLAKPMVERLMAMLLDPENLTMAVDEVTI